MSEYIERKDVIKKLMDGALYDFPESIKRELAEKALADLPIFRVVRCKDCKYNPSNPRSWDDDDIVEHYLWCEFMAIESKYNYCSKGKRSEEWKGVYVRYLSSMQGRYCS